LVRVGRSDHQAAKGSIRGGFVREAARNDVESGPFLTFAHAPHRPVHRRKYRCRNSKMSAGLSSNSPVRSARKSPAK
jgi:hypothetical protein